MTFYELPIDAQFTFVDDTNKRNPLTYTKTSHDGFTYIVGMTSEQIINNKDRLVIMLD